jgi:hypothetical protein
MRKQLLIIEITLIMIIVEFSSCTDNNSKETNNKFVGKWESINDTEGETFYDTITFYSD